MDRKKLWQRLTCWLLALSLWAGNLPLAAMAAEVTEPETVPEETVISEETAATEETVIPEETETPAGTEIPAETVAAEETESSAPSPLAAEDPAGVESQPGITWEQGTIANATGLDRDDTTRLRTVGYLNLTDYSAVTVETGYTLVRFVYDGDYNYINGTPWLGNGVGFSVDALRAEYPEAVYLRVALRAMDSRVLTPEEISDSGIAFYAPGEQVPGMGGILQYTDLGSIGSWQDGAIWGGKLFVLGGSGSGAVYDPDTLTKLGTLTLGSTDVLKPHANSVSFGNAFYAPGDKYPLLYVNVYNNYASEADRKEGTCCVYRITESGDSFSGELVQVISIGFTEDLGLWKSKENNGDVRPYGNFAVDAANGKLWAFVMRDAELTTRFFRFDLPAPEAGTYSEIYRCNLVTLEVGDIEAQFDTAYFHYLQGCTLRDGKLLSLEGFHSGGSAAPKLRVVDLTGKTLEVTYDLALSGLTKEPEVVCADPETGKLFYAAADGVLRVLDLPEMPPQGCSHNYQDTICILCGAAAPGQGDGTDGHLQALPENVCSGTNLWTALTPENIYYTVDGWGLFASAPNVHSVTFPVTPGERVWATSFQKAGVNGNSANGTRITWFDENGLLATVDRNTVYAEFSEKGYITVPEGAAALNVPMSGGEDTYEVYLLDRAHEYENGSCLGCGKKDYSNHNYKGKVISILSASTSTFAGWIPVADGFNLEHRARYPQDNLFSDVESTWWHQLITQLDARLGINDSWAGSQVLNTRDTNSGDLGPDAAMASLTRIQNLGANGTPDLILFFGAGNDMGRGVDLGTFDPAAAPSEPDLEAYKWDSLAEAYTEAILRMRYFYPNARIVAMTTYAMPSYVTNAKLDKYGPVLKSICDHYGVEQVSLRDCGVTFDMLPDNIHPNAEGMDHITQALLDYLLEHDAMEEGENTVYPVTHNLTNARASKHYYKGISAGAAFEETLDADAVTVTMGGVDITAQVYSDGMIRIPQVTGELVITAEGVFDADGHLQQLPGQLCPGVNLWKALIPENIYYTASGWGNTAGSNSWSVTFPVQPGDRVWATSLGAYPENGSGANGVRVTWFLEDGTVSSLTRDVVYGEFSKNGCITAPEGAVALNMPMTNNEERYAVYLLSSSHSWIDGNAVIKACSLCGSVEGGYRIDVPEDEIWIDGVQQTVYRNDSGTFLQLEHTDAKIMTAYSYNDAGSEDPHAQYPTGMQVWRLRFENGAYTVEAMPEWEDLLQYAGSSIRVTGVKGIRMITGIQKALRSTLIEGTSGYRLLEYGTAVSWSADGSVPVLGRGYTMSNYAYKRDTADPIFADTGDTVQYTNVLVGFTDDQLGSDLVMRPYIILEDSEGQQITVYGGCVQRSIGCIAKQNQDTFPEDSKADAYIEDIISKVYG